MNNKLFASFVGSLVLASSVSSQAVVLIEDFSSGFGGNNTPIAGNNGWTSNEAIGAGTPPGNLSFISTLGSTTYGKSGAIGGGLDEASGSNPTVSLTNVVTGEMNYVSMSITFFVVGSLDYPDRDGFGFSLRDENGVNLFSVGLGVAINSSFQINYTVGTGATANMQDTNGDPIFIAMEGLYTLNLSFQANGANPLFQGSVVGSNTVNFNGVANGLGDKSVGQFSVDWNVIGNGGNTMVFDNITVIPEASSFALACLGLLGFVRRRR